MNSTNNILLSDSNFALLNKFQQREHLKEQLETYFTALKEKPNVNSER